MATIATVSPAERPCSKASISTAGMCSPPRMMISSPSNLDVAIGSHTREITCVEPSLRIHWVKLWAL